MTACGEEPRWAMVPFASGRHAMFAEMRQHFGTEKCIWHAERNRSGKMAQFASLGHHAMHVEMRQHGGMGNSAWHAAKNHGGVMARLVWREVHAVNVVMRHGRIWEQSVVETNGVMELDADWEPLAIFVKIRQRIGQERHLQHVEANHAGAEVRCASHVDNVAVGTNGNGRSLHLFASNILYLLFVFYYCFCCWFVC